MADEPSESPIEGLKDLDQETSADFVDRVRRKIERRRTVSQLAGFYWQVPHVVAMEMAGIFRHMLTAVNGKKEPER